MTQMLKKHMATSVCVCVCARGGDGWILLLITKNKCSLKKVPLSQHVFIFKSSIQV